MSGKPRPYSVWRHVKTDSLHVVLGVAAVATNGERGAGLEVIYVSPVRPRLLFARDLVEFMDGRFREESRT